MVLDESKWVFSFFTPCHPETYGPEKQLFAFVALKSAVMSRFLFDVFLYFFFFFRLRCLGRPRSAATRRKVSWLSISHISQPLLLIIIEGLGLAD